MAHLILAPLLLAMSTYVESAIDNSESVNQKATKILPRRVRDLEDQYGSFKELFTSLEERFATECSKSYQEIGRCPTVYDESQEHQMCFKIFHAMKAQFDDAKEICAIAQQGQLIVLNTPKKFSFIQDKLKAYYQTNNQTSNYWIGLERGDHDFTVWMDDSSFNATNWAPGQPNNHMGRQNCGYFDMDQSYMVGDRNCDSTMSFICEVPRMRCPTGYKESQEHHMCFKIVHAMKAQFDDAKQICAIAQQGQLIILNTPKKFSLIQDELKAYNQTNDGTSNYWIGLERGDHDFNVWMDGTSFNATYWAPWQPSNGSGNQNCGYLDKAKSYMVGDRECDRIYSFICEVPLSE